MVCALTAAGIAASPVAAAKKGAHRVNCQKVRDEVASGKSEDDVAKDMKLSATQVKNCTNPPAKHSAKKKAM